MERIFWRLRCPALSVMRARAHVQKNTNSWGDSAMKKGSPSRFDATSGLWGCQRTPAPGTAARNFVDTARNGFV